MGTLGEAGTGSTVICCAELTYREITRAMHRRWPALDGIRAVAVSAVFAYHGGARWAHGGGEAGVTFFFVLSGFLITDLLTSEVEAAGSINLPAFYLRRLTRLVPALMVTLVAGLLLGPLLTEFPIGIIAKASLAAASFSMNWVRAFELGPSAFLGHTWSLGVEEQFYLLWPVLLLLLGRSRRRIFWTALSLAAASTLWRWWLMYHGGSFARIYNGFDTHADPILVGCALACLGEEARRRLVAMSRVLMPAVIVALVARVSLFYGGQAQSLADPAVSALCAAVILVCTDKEKSIVGALLSLPPLIWIGRISYGIYLWHGLILTALFHQHCDSRLLLPLAACLTIGISALSYFQLEEPLLRRRRGAPLDPPLRSLTPDSEEQRAEA